MEKAATKFVQILCLCVLFLGGAVQAQVSTPPLERVVSVELSGQSTREALKLIETEGRFSFAYRTDIVDQSNMMTRAYVDQTVREILDDLFQGAISYKTKGNYIILRDNPKQNSSDVVLEGYIINAANEEKIAYASIYDTTTFASAVSNEYGHYTIKLSTKEDIYLTVRKAGFQDTTFQWRGEDPNVFSVRLQPEIVEPVVEPATVEDSSETGSKKLKDMKFFKPSEEQKANLINFKNKLKRKVQFSVVPGVGTNGKLSGVTKVDYSINLLGGFNGGVRVAEVGALFNIDWDSVSYFQAAGIFNAVGGPQRGAQFAGFTNLNNDKFKGAQFAGFLNVVRQDIGGAQFAGFGNFMGDSSKAVQAAGFGNFASHSSGGTQLAGFGNFAGNGYLGGQIAGFGNFAGNTYQGGQIAGFGNFAGKNSSGTQIAGFMNVADSNYTGGQIAGFINVAQKIKGTQLGFININDSIEGVPIGFFTFSRKGLHQLEISANEVFPVNLAFKTGTNQFYNIFSTGTRFDSGSAPTWNIGYGIGTSVRTSPRSRIFFDLQTLGLHRGGTGFDGSSLNKLTVSYHFNIWDKVAIAAGPSMNVLVTNSTSTSTADYGSLAPYNFYEHNSGSVNTQMWVGGHLALRFF